MKESGGAVSAGHNYYVMGFEEKDNFAHKQIFQ